MKSTPIYKMYSSIVSEPNRNFSRDDFSLYGYEVYEVMKLHSYFKKEKKKELRISSRWFWKSLILFLELLKTEINSKRVIIKSLYLEDLKCVVLL